MVEPQLETQYQNPYSLSGIALARFREAFGEPGLAAGHDHQWSLKTAPFGHDIHILLNGQEHRPIVWIFDPNDRADGVSRSVVEHEDGIGDIVNHVRDRVKKASQTMRKAEERQK
jgi:hypothetical protein